MIFTCEAVRGNFITEIRPWFKFENSLDQIKQEFKIKK